MRPGWLACELPRILLALTCVVFPRIFWTTEAQYHAQLCASLCVCVHMHVCMHIHVCAHIHSYKKEERQQEIGILEE